jgi:hypothetical protein
LVTLSRRGEKAVLRSDSISLCRGPVMQCVLWGFSSRA